MSAVITRGKVTRADLSHWDGRNATVSRLDASGGTVTALAIGNEVDVLQVFGAGTSRTRASIAAATAYLGSTTVTLTFAPGTWTIDENLTIPSDFTCRIPRGCTFSVSSGRTLTFSGPVFADSTSFYTGSGSTVLSADSIVGGKPWFARTAVETSAGVTPTDHFIVPGHLFRYANSANIGNGTNDDTTSWANCLLACSGAPYRMYVPQPSSKYKVGPLTVPDNITIYFERGVIIEAIAGYGSTDCLLDFDGASNVTIDANEAICRMLKAEYVSGENRHCFNLVDCTDVLIKNPVAKDSGGDGYYINGATRLTLENAIADNNRRQGFSLIKATTLRMPGITRLLNTTGTAPQCGFDIEPNSDADDLIDIVIDTIYCEGNDGDAVAIYLDDYKTGTPEDVSISIGKIISRGNGRNALRARNIYLNSGSYGGYIDIGEVISYGDPANAVFIEDKSSAAPFLHIGKVTAFNPCTGASSFADTGAVYLGDTSAATSGGIHIDSISVRATHSDMDYGVIAEMGAGFTDVRIGIANIVGYQVAPVRWNNITSTIAAASSMLVDVSKLRDSVALTSDTDIVATAHSGRIITNAGAAGAITLSLREYLPAGNPYRFRVEAAQALRIDTYDATDQIIGTTAAGVRAICSTLGEECEVYFVGTLSGVRYWRLKPLGNPFAWETDGYIGSIAVTDGITAPSTLSGKTVIYTDVADGDLKVKFGDGTVKTLATDT